MLFKNSNIAELEAQIGYYLRATLQLLLLSPLVFQLQSKQICVSLVCGVKAKNIVNSCPGGCDVNGFCDGTCKCYVGWDLNATTCVGKLFIYGYYVLTNTDVNECTSKPCSDWTTTCVNIPGSFTCPCAPGTILNGTGLCQMCSGGYFSNNTNSANCDICPAGTWSKSKDQITGYLHLCVQFNDFRLWTTVSFQFD